MTEGGEETNENTSINLEEIDQVLTELLKGTNCDEAGKNKIYQATLMVSCMICALRSCLFDEVFNVESHFVLPFYSFFAFSAFLFLSLGA